MSIQSLSIKQLIRSGQEKGPEGEKERKGRAQSLLLHVERILSS